MSLYNMINGFSLECLLFMPMLGRKRNEYPRFRDCFLSEDGKHIDIFTRVGGGNRNRGYGEEALYEDINFVETFDDEFDCTYATYRFNPPDKWKEDLKKIVAGKLKEVSDEYVLCVKEFFPLLNEHGMIDEVFRNITQDEKIDNLLSEQVPKGNFKGSQDDDSGWDGE